MKDKQYYVICKTKQKGLNLKGKPISEFTNEDETATGLRLRNLDYWPPAGPASGSGPAPSALVLVP